ncbi:flagellin [Marinobacterium litorale]|uniref:flagellin N-terminal helical domain-containing protein n=1 Tax=Marinobacterium litorale TaxID=404770 RepID=UPI000426C693|nr:flagellin [Marinobacterium litorale]
MALIINSNISSLNAQRQLASNAESLNTAMERLTSGRRINNAADDAAGLAIANRMTSQVRGLNQAVRNANDGISLIQTAEGALVESTNILQRIRELSIQSANGTYSDGNRSTLNAEVQQLVKELDRISETTTFNGLKLLSGETDKLDLQVGASANELIGLELQSTHSSELGLRGLSGDLVSSAITLNSNGEIANSILPSDLKINGQSIERIASGDSVQTLIDKITNSISGVTAEAYVELEASAGGSGILSGGDSVDITYRFATGEQVSISVNNTNSLQELADAIVEKSGGNLAADITDDGRLMLSGTGLATLSVTDSSGATGITAGTGAGSSIHQNIIDRLSQDWIREAETLITDYFGLTAGNDTPIDLIFAETDGTLTGDLSDFVGNLDDLRSDGASGRIAAVWSGSGDLKLVVDMADFVSLEGSDPYYNDRIIAHEMVHAVMAAKIPALVNTALPGFFTEGVSELLHGADSRVLGDISANIPPAGTLADGIAAFADPGVLKMTSGSPSDSLGYSAGYVALKMMEDGLASAGGQSISDIFDDLEVGFNLDAALVNSGVNWGTGTGLTAFETFYYANVEDYLTEAVTGSATYSGLGTVSMNLQSGDTDTGSIAGADYVGGSILTATSVLPNTATGGPINFDLQLPDGYSTGTISASAQLVLSSDRGETITVERGLTGTLADLAFLGFRESPDPGVINGVGLTEPNTAWEKGQIEINGVEVDVTDTDTFYGKIDAINAISDETGVVASLYSSGTLKLGGFDYDTWSNNSWGDFALNGVVMTGIGNDASIQELAETFNSFTGDTGISARIHGNDIILEGNAPITFSDVPDLGPTAALAFGHPSGGGAKFISSATEAANGEATDVQDGTSAKAGISLRSLDGSAISLELGNTPVGTTGWLEVNSAQGGISGSTLSGLDISTVAGAQKAISSVDNAMEQIDQFRSQLGAVNNRLDFTINNLSSISENISAARSRVEDADFAKESATLSRAQVLQQAGTAMLAQANAMPQQVLSLLR